MSINDIVIDIEQLKLYRQSRVVRWQLRDFVFAENDSEHQLFVSQIILYLINKLNINNDIAFTALKYAIVHDYVESCSGVGDVNYAVKEQIPELKNIVEALEDNAMRSVPAFYAAKKDCENDEVAKIIVSLADSLEAHLYVRREVEHNVKKDEWLQITDETGKRVEKLYQLLLSKLGDKNG